MSEYRPTSQAAARGFPDPGSPGLTIVNCPYCIDAREQIGSKLAGCLRHSQPENVDSPTMTDRAVTATERGTK